MTVLQITTASPMQQQGQAPRDPATPGAQARGQPQHSMQLQQQLQHRVGASTDIQALQERQGMKAQLLAPLCPELNAQDPAALLHSSARVLREMQADDFQEQLQHLQQRKVSRQMQQLHHRHQHQQLQQQQQQVCPQALQDASLAAYTHICCFDARAAAANNLSIRCHGSTAGSTRGSHSAHTPMHGTASPSAFNNVGGLALSPVSIRAPELTAAPTAVTGLLPTLQQPQHSTSTSHRLSTSSASTAGPLVQTKQGSRGDWLGLPAGAAAFWQHARARPPAYKPGMHALLTPSAREAAAADAVADCAYEAAAMQTVQPDAKVKLAKELAAAAVQAARTEVAVIGAATGQSPSSVPQEAWGYDRQPCRSLSSIKTTVQHSPAATDSLAAHVSNSAGRRTPNRASPAARSCSFSNWAGSSAFTAPAARQDSDFAAFAFSTAGPASWQQGQTAPCKGRGGAGAAAGRLLQDPGGFHQQAASSGGGCWGQQQEQPAPRTPRLEGVDYDSDRRTILCYSTHADAAALIAESAD